MPLGRGKNQAYFYDRDNQLGSMDLRSALDNSSDETPRQLIDKIDVKQRPKHANIILTSAMVKNKTSVGKAKYKSM